MNNGCQPQPGRLQALSAEELARRTTGGCRASFAELVVRYSPGLYQFLRRRTDNAQDAEDLVQDTFVRAFENIDRYRSSYKFSTWLFTIARRLASSSWRSKRLSPPLTHVKPSCPGPHEAMARQETQRSLWDAARKLTANQHQVLCLRYAEDMTIREIAKVMGKSQVNVKVLLYRGRTNLANKLQSIPAKDRVKDHKSSKETLIFMKAEGA